MFKYLVIPLGLGLGFIVGGYDKLFKNKDEGILITGKQFKKKYPNYIPVKVIGKNINNFQYKMGINKNNEPFQPFGNGGGLFFTSTEKVFRHMNHGDKIAFIELIDDEPIFVEWDGDECKTDKFNITKIESVTSFMKNSPLTMEKLKLNGSLIRHIENPSKEFQLTAVKENGRAIQYIQNPDKEVQLEAVKQNGYAIELFKTQTKNFN